MAEQSQFGEARTTQQLFTIFPAPATYADISDLHEEVGFTPETSIETGIPKFVDWYKSYYKVTVES